MKSNKDDYGAFNENSYSPLRNSITLRGSIRTQYITHLNTAKEMVIDGRKLSPVEMKERNRRISWYSYCESKGLPLYQPVPVKFGLYRKPQNVKPKKILVNGRKFVLATNPNSSISSSNV